jgi:hypothetical protein
VLCAVAEEAEVRLDVAEDREEALLLDALAELAEEAELELALDREDMDMDIESEDAELAEALDAEDAEDAEDSDDAELVAEAVEAAREAVLVAPWTWKPPLKL